MSNQYPPTEKPMNAATLLMTPQFLADLLRLPQGTVCHKAGMSEDGTLITVVVEHPGLPPVGAGQEPETYTATYQKHHTEQEPKVVFVGWHKI